MHQLSPLLLCLAHTEKIENKKGKSKKERESECGVFGCCEAVRETTTCVFLVRLIVCVCASPLYVQVNGNKLLSNNIIVSVWWKLPYFPHFNNLKQCEGVRQVCFFKCSDLAHRSRSADLSSYS